MQFQILLSHVTSNLFLFMGEIHRLCKEEKSFMMQFRGGNKLFLHTCKGLQKNAYICVLKKASQESIITTINYAIAKHAVLQLSLESNILYVNVYSDDIEEIKKFARSLNCNVD